MRMKKQMMLLERVGMEVVREDGGINCPPVALRGNLFPRRTSRSSNTDAPDRVFFFNTPGNNFRLEYH